MHLNIILIVDLLEYLLKILYMLLFFVIPGLIALIADKNNKDPKRYRRTEQKEREFTYKKKLSENTNQIAIFR